LNTAVGHLHAIRKLVEAGRSCEEVVHQLKAVKAALRVIKSRLVDYQVKHSEEIIINGSIETQSELAGLFMAISSITVTLNTLLIKRFKPSFRHSEQPWFFLLASSVFGSYPLVAKLRGSFWVGLLSLIVPMPVVTAQNKRKK